MTQQSKPLFNLPPRSQDERTVAERRWSAPLKAAAEQRPCDHGLFGDAKSQLDAVVLVLLQPTDASIPLNGSGRRQRDITDNRE